jgi:D-psicose/D-tagatose/L-ribulose 3-epimerase
MLIHLTGICRVGHLLGGTKLVFGSPKNRDKGELSQDEVVSRAVSFFGELGDIAADSGVIICLEPNPTQYGANFMINAKETAFIVNSISHPAIKMQLDLGALAMNNEDLEQTLTNHSGIIGHIHISEPNLVPIGDANTDHQSAAKLLNEWFGGGTATLEMLSDGKDSGLESLERALHASRFYLDSEISI